MVKKTKGKHCLDKFYHLAKEQGYRSRAAFKLIQLNRKYHFLESSRSLLDLCAAPGGWLQVAVKHMPMSSLIIGMDLVAIRPIRGCKTLIGDITTQKARQAIKKESGGAMMNTVIHDGAPNVGGAWASEAYSQSALVLEALKLACDTLAPKGTFVTKIFRSQDYNALLYAFNQLFTKVEATKPAASRNTSAEIFVVCLGYKAPSKIDPRLLDAKHLFQEVNEMPKSMGPDALLKQKIKQKRHREGYEEGLSTMHKPLAAAAFVVADNPVELLGQHSVLSLSGPNAVPPSTVEKALELAAFVESNPATDAEVVALCADLQVLGRSEFKTLLKWRMQVRKDWKIHLAKQQGEIESDGNAEAEAEKAENDEEAVEARLLAEMKGIKDQMDKRKKKERKRKHEQRVKARVRAAQLALGEGINQDTGNEALFSLSSLKAKGAASELADSAAPGQEELAILEADSDDDASVTGDSDGSDADAQDRRYEADMEANLEDLYQGYLKRKGIREGKLQQKRRRLGMDGEMGSDDDASDVEAADTAAGIQDAAEEQEGDGLLVQLDGRRAGRPKTNAAIAAQWFAQDIFAGVDVAEGEDDDTVDGLAKHQQQQRGQKAAAGAAKDTVQPEASIQAKAAPAQATAKQKAAAPTQADGFEEVPMGRQKSPDSDADSDASSDDGFDDLDDNGKAEVMALAKRMLQGRDKQDIIDDAYNRYAFHDDGLPGWFMDDEAKHNRAPEVVSKEEIQAEKARLQAIDARPIKKVAEAKMRKRKRMATKLEAARAKAEAVSGQDDVPMKAKMREIEKIYAKARAAGKGKGKKKKPTRSDQYKNKGKPLDGRLRSDKRQVNFKTKAKVAKKARKGKKGGKAKSTY